MSNTTDWISKNLSLGGIVSNIGSGIGSASSLVANGIGSAAGIFTTDEKTKKYLQESCDGAGSAIDNGLKRGSATVGDFINFAVNTFGDAVGNVSANAAETFGASNENVEMTRNVGKVVGAAAVGLVAGAGIANVATAVGAAAGTSGAAATSSGLAALGGGSIAAGGGGMAVGQAVTQGIIAASTASGLASTTNKIKK